jgi:YVTN family beta-propeller protein
VGIANHSREPFVLSNRFARRCFSVVIAGVLFTLPALAQTPYKVIDQWKIGGTGGWDYLTSDPAAHLLYVTHGPRVEVIDTTTGKPVGAITGMKGTHGVALDATGKYGYISDGGSNAVVVFDRQSFATIATIPTEANPDGIVYEPVTATVWAFNGRSKSVSVIDTASNQVAATIPLPGKPEFPTVDGKGNVFDNIESTDQVVKLDAKSRAITATWKLECDSPSGQAIDTVHRRVFTVCDDKQMAVVDTAAGMQIAYPDIGTGPDAAAFSPEFQLAFSSNGEGTLSVVDTAHGFKTIETLPTLKGARTMAYDPATDRIYLVTAQFGPTPAPTDTMPRPRPAVIPDSFTVLVVGRK